MPTSSMSGRSFAPLDNSPPGIQTIPGGAGEGGGFVLTIVGPKPDCGPAQTRSAADNAISALLTISMVTAAAPPNEPALLDERNLPGEVVPDQRADLALDLEIARDLHVRHRAPELREVRLVAIDLLLVEREDRVGQLAGLLVRDGPAVVSLRVLLHGLDEAVGGRREVLLVGLVHGPELLRLGLGQVHVLCDQQLLVGAELVAKDVHVVRGLFRRFLLREGDRGRENGGGCGDESVPTHRVLLISRVVQAGRSYLEAHCAKPCLSFSIAWSIVKEAGLWLGGNSL